MYLSSSPAPPAREHWRRPAAVLAARRAARGLAPAESPGVAARLVQTAPNARPPLRPLTRQRRSTKRRLSIGHKQERDLHVQPISWRPTPRSDSPATPRA